MRFNIIMFSFASMRYEPIFYLYHKVLPMTKPLDRTGTWRTYSIADGLAGMRVEHIVEDSEGYLWFATWNNGVSRFDGDEFQNFTRRDGLISDSVYFVSQDSQSRLWFGTLNGLCWYDGDRVPPFGGRGDRRSNCAEHLSKTVRAVYGVAVTGLWDITTALCTTT